MKTMNAIIGTMIVVSMGLLSCAQQGEAKVEEAVIQIPTANCDMCVETIKKAAQAVEGVSDAEIDLEKKVAKVKFQSAKASLVQIEKAVAKAGYDANDSKRDEEAYEALPACCK